MSYSSFPERVEYTHMRYQGSPSAKWYSVYRIGTLCITRWGAAGAMGQWKVDNLPSGSAAVSAANAKIALKLSSGYMRQHEVVFDVPHELLPDLATASGKQNNTLQELAYYANLEVNGRSRSATPVATSEEVTPDATVQGIHRLAKHLESRMSSDASLEELLDAWRALSDLWEEMNTAYNELAPLIPELGKKLTTRLMGGSA